jgi:hypothetical protein
MIRYLSAAAAAFILVAAASSSAGAATAQPASWHIVYQARTTNSTSLYGITAPSTTDAWAVGYTTYSHGGTTPDFVQWNGTRWQAVTIAGTSSFQPWVAESTSPSDVWFFGEVNSTFEALHLVNGSWQVLATPGDISTGTIAVLGSNNVWMIGLGGGCNETTGRCTTQLQHWNGQAWTSYVIGTRIESIAGWGTHMWAVGISGPDVASEATGYVVLYQFTDGAWEKFTAPRPRTSSPPMLAAAPDGHLWLLAPPMPGSARWIVHLWAHQAWTEQAVPAGLVGAVQMGPPMTYDGRNGVWLGPYLHWTGSNWVDALEANPFPSLTGFGFQAITPVPASGSLWAAGVDNNGRLIAVYGSQP